MEKKIVSINVGFGNKNVTNEYNISRQDFEVTPDWFNELFKKHYTKDIDSKYIPKLFVDTGIAEELFNEVTNIDNEIPRFLNEIRILKDWLFQFINEYKELQLLFIKENIHVNESSDQHKQLELLKSKKEYLDNTIKTFNKTLETKDLNQISSLIEIKNEGLLIASDFKISRLEEYLLKDKYIDKAPNPDDRYTVEIVFRRLQEIVSQIKSLNRFLVRFQRQVFFIHGNAGMGKSNISAHITKKLVNNNYPVIFIKAKSFRGNPDEFDEILMRELLIPDNYRLQEILNKLNEYGKTKNKRVTLIFDGLNETSYENHGFSPIWRNSLDDFISLTKEYPFIFVVLTLRTSYVNRIWDSKIPYSNFEIQGFTEVLIPIVENYFEYYKIKHEELELNDIFYFKTPLLLDLYCQMLNPSRVTEVDAILGLDGFKVVFEKYVEKLSIEVTKKLQLISKDLVLEGVNKCSVVMLEEVEANMAISKYYELMDNESIKSENDTIGYNVLEGYLIYLKDSYNKKDVIVHTQQEVGGYLLAKELLNKHKSFEAIVNSDFFKKHIVGKDEDFHQLKDDILKFLVVHPDAIETLIDKYPNNPIIKTFIWIKLQREETNPENIELRKILSKSLNDFSDIKKLLDDSKSNFLVNNSPLNFHYFISKFTKLNNFEFDRVLTRFLYENTGVWDRYLDAVLKIILNSNAPKEIEVLLESDFLKIDIIIWFLESTSNDFRDKATLALLEFSTKYPQYIFDKVNEYSIVARPYIYERLTAICYGVCLRKQNDDEFINRVFKKQISTIYNLQFGKAPTASTYNYIVIDSLKHIVDLSIYKEVFSLNEPDLERLKNYNFNPVEQWQEITEEDTNYVASIVGRWHNSAKSDPLKGDFVHYTISRLQARGAEGPQNRLTATANIYKRLIELGYITEDKFEPIDKQENKFYFGEKPERSEGKIDRLGKKYSWMAFFDYAGYLLNKGLLNVWYGNVDEENREYNRLGDVDIEVSCPFPVIYKEKLFNINLLKYKNEEKSWTEKPFYEESKLIWKQDFEEGNFTLVKGYLEQRPNKSYDVRTFLLIESFLVKKEDIEEQEGNIINQEFDWNYDFHSNSSINHVYFGELYWADNIPEGVSSGEAIPTLNEDGEIDRRLYTTESTNSEYMWESGSKIFKTLRGNIPSPNIGKYLKLNADAENFQILDEEGSLAFKSYEFEEPDLIKQELDYLRTDLLNKYMDEKGLVLIYQIKQHTYDRLTEDGLGDFRGMQFFFPHLDNN